MIKVVWNIVKKIFSVILLLLSPLKRLWCRRKRKNSDTLLPLTNHYPSVEFPENLGSSPMLNGSSGQNYEELGSWDTWEEESKKIRSVQDYRQHQQQLLQKQTSQEEEEHEADYFQDMIPSLKRQKRVLISKKEDKVNTTAISSKLAAKADFSMFQSSELETWEDENNAWEDEDQGDLSYEAENVIREKRRMERQQRQLENQRKKYEREQQRHVRGSGQFSAVKLS